MSPAKRLALAAVAIALAACSPGQTTGPSITTANVGSPSYSKVQFAVGTANIYGSITGLNVVSTLRQPNGESAVGVDTPTIRGPFVNTSAAAAADGASFGDPYTSAYFMSTGPPQVGAGPSLPESTSSTPIITGTAQSVHPGTPVCDSVGPPPAGFIQCPAGIPPNTTTFGQSGGVFAMGIAPYNVVANTAQAYSYAPYPQPMYDNGQTHPLFVAWGGPPAFDPDGNGMGTRDGLIILGTDALGFNYFLGVGEGLSVFEGVTPSTGVYSLAVQISFVASGGGQQSVTFTVNAGLGSTALLPTVTAPFVTPNPSLDGGATFTAAALPAGVTEELVQIVDYGPGGGPLAGGGASIANCQGPKGTSFSPVYYTVVVKAAGSYNVGRLHGPNNLAGGAGTLTPTQTICTEPQNNAVAGAAAGDNFTVQVIGFDYPEYEAALSLTQGSTPQTPQITGASGQSDITISLPVEEDWTSSGYVATTLTGTRRPLARRGMAHSFVRPIGPADMYRKLGVPAPRW